MSLFLLHILNTILTEKIGRTILHTPKLTEIPIEPVQKSHLIASADAPATFFWPQLPTPGINSKLFPPGAAQIQGKVQNML